MRTSLAAAVVVLGLAVPATAEPDTALMDLNQGPWDLVSADGASCSLMLGDCPAKDFARVLEDAGDCRDLDPALSQATAWRIDEPGELLLLSDGGKTVLRLTYHRDEGTFGTIGRTPELTLQPLD